MPVYDFFCETCDERDEARCALADYDKLKANPPKCRKCGKPMVRLIRPVVYVGWSWSQGIPSGGNDGFGKVTG